MLPAANATLTDHSGLLMGRICAHSANKRRRRIVRSGKRRTGTMSFCCCDTGSECKSKGGCCVREIPERDLLLTLFFSGSFNPKHVRHYRCSRRLIVFDWQAMVQLEGAADGANEQARDPHAFILCSHPVITTMMQPRSSPPDWPAMQSPASSASSVFLHLLHLCIFREWIRGRRTGWRERGDREKRMDAGRRSTGVLLHSPFINVTEMLKLR